MIKLYTKKRLLTIVRTIYDSIAKRYILIAGLLLGKNMKLFAKGLVFFTSIFIAQTSLFAEANNVHTVDKTSFVITADTPEFILKLKSNPTTGYTWVLSD